MILLAVFLFVESRAVEPMLPLSLFRVRLLSATVVVTFAVGFALISVPFFTTQFLQSVQGMSVLQAGLRSLPFTLTLMATPPIAGRLVNRVGFGKPVALGALLGALGLWALAGLHPSTPYGDIWWRQAIAGTGFGFSIAPLSAAALAAVDARRAGLASSVVNTARQVGAALSIALLGAVVATRSHASALASLLALPPAARQAAAAAISRSGAQPIHTSLAGLSQTQAQHVGAVAYVAGIHGAFLIVAGTLLLAGLIAIFWLRIVPET